MARAENTEGSLPEPQKNTKQAAVPFCWGGQREGIWGGMGVVVGGSASETDFRAGGGPWGSPPH